MTEMGCGFVMEMEGWTKVASLEEKVVKREEDCSEVMRATRRDGWEGRENERGSERGQRVKTEA